ncbi:hypothetical protein Sta7437_3533 [Stanieria cyanosphaera PCC 7437]|uniref:Glycosyltransferase family 1 protein n=1 Tax=Stanieria cyanosphaera (strain ATCC 29371 / PCC 7437) TaxID=111780 RepID=K9XY47_STAC7|nr:hypothetical protein [Stanieria cyanosphaera]AFZ37031.1 hypothetical protein Sta7437_3533 [Stanieria cyanosphaera PCC 7437]
MEKIYFYAPTENKKKLLQSNYKDSWEGEHSNFTAWIAQTYFHLKNAGVSCEITNTIDRQGIVIADRDTLGDNAQFLTNTMLICAKSDREYHPSAHIHVVHNPQDYQLNYNSVWKPYYIAHWPIPNLIPRNQERKFTVENVAYIGSRSQLAQELKSQYWIESLSSLGCKWLPIFEVNQWNDYTKLDVIVAARSFRNNQYINKGFIKLLNCWHAGVPGILTPESSFVAVRKSELDFLSINSIDEAIAAVRRLKTDSDFYCQMLNNYQKRKQEVTTEKVLSQWIFFFKNIVTEYYQQWLLIPSYQKKYLFMQKLLSLKSSRIKQRLHTFSVIK